MKSVQSVQNIENMKKNIDKLEKITLNNAKKIKTLQRLLYIQRNNIKLKEGRNGGIYYKTKKSKIYIKN